MAMSCSSQIRLCCLAVGSLLMQACVSVPQVENRLKEMQLPPHTYVARPGDTMATVAFRYQLDEAQLIAMNPHITRMLVAGDRVVVHDLPSAMAASDGLYLRAPQSVSQNNTLAPSQNSSILPGQSAQTHGTTITAVAPRMASAPPTYSTPAGDVPFDQITEIQANAINPNGARLPIEEVVTDDWDYSSLPVATDEQLSTGSAGQRLVAAPQGNGTRGWVWPTWGQVARDFAPTEAGGQGIDIAGLPGQEIHAASNGTVAYAGRDLAGGNGKLIILRHSDGLMTTYSHADQLFVAEDDVVRAGDVIASLGTNAQNMSILRFEVRRDGNPLNPMNFLAN